MCYYANALSYSSAFKILTNVKLCKPNNLTWKGSYCYLHVSKTLTCMQSDLKAVPIKSNVSGNIVEQMHLEMHDYSASKFTSYCRPWSRVQMLMVLLPSES